MYYEELEWRKVSTNDKKMLQNLRLECERDKVRYNISRDNPDYPPAIFMLCTYGWFRRMKLMFGIRKF